MTTSTKLTIMDKVKTVYGAVGTVVEFDTQLPYTVCLMHSQNGGKSFRRWYKKEEILTN